MLLRELRTLRMLRQRLPFQPEQKSEVGTVADPSSGGGGLLAGSAQHVCVCLLGEPCCHGGCELVLSIMSFSPPDRYVIGFSADTSCSQHE